MPRGGPRPGAGAPLGNLNALKTGRRSKQVEALTDAILANPNLLRLILKLGRLDIKHNQELRHGLREAARRRQRRSIKQNAPQQIPENAHFCKQHSIKGGELDTACRPAPSSPRSPNPTPGGPQP